MNRLEAIGRDLDDAAGEAFLPPGWQRLVATIPDLLTVAEAARGVVEHMTTAVMGDARHDWCRKASQEGEWPLCIGRLDKVIAPLLEDVP